jgi:hypothetical protein
MQAPPSPIEDDDNSPSEDVDEIYEQEVSRNESPTKKLKAVIKKRSRSKSKLYDKDRIDCGDVPEIQKTTRCRVIDDEDEPCFDDSDVSEDGMSRSDGQGDDDGSDVAAVDDNDEDQGSNEDSYGSICDENEDVLSDDGEESGNFNGNGRGDISKNLQKVLRRGVDEEMYESSDES